MIGLLLLLGTIGAVFAAAGRLSGDLRLEERLGLALALGPVLLAWAAYLAALQLGVGPAAGVAGCFAWVALAIGLLGRERSARRTLRAQWHDLWQRVRYAGARAALLLCTALFVAFLLGAALSDSLVELPDGSLAAGTVNNLGDLPLHIGIAHAFAYGRNVPPENVIFSGTRLAYPFIPDLLTGLLITCGWKTCTAIWMPVMGVLCGFFLLLSSLTFRASGKALAAGLVPPLFLLCGGSQPFLALWDGFMTPENFRWAGLLRQTLEPPDSWHIEWKNALTSLLVTQRATAFGLSLLVAAIFCLWMALDRPGPIGDTSRLAGSRRLFFVAGVLLGLLPMVFGHGFLAMAIALPLFLFVPRSGLRRHWIQMGLVAGVVAAPQVVWLAAHATGSGQFFSWTPGWLAGEGGWPGLASFFWFWVKNLGPFLPLCATAWLLRGRIGLVRPSWWLPWWACFVVPSLFGLAPWAWDNVKVYIVWYSLTVVPVSVLIAWMLAQRAELRILAVGALIWLCASGALELWHVIFREGHYFEYSAEGVRTALRLREVTAAKAVILERPHWAQLALLAGRRSVMGYAGHLWSYGIDSTEREAQILAFYRSLAGAALPGETRSRVRPFLERYRIDYVLAGPDEERFCGCDLAGAGRVLREVFREGAIVVYAARSGADDDS